jgi:TonB family protein
MESLKLITAVFLLVISTALLGTRSSNGSMPSQSAPATDGPKYENSADGLQKLMENMLDAARAGKQEQLARMLRDTEIPNCGEWLHMMYRSDTADSWMGLCDPKLLGLRHQELADQLAGIAREGGRITVRNVTENPEGGKGGLESGMVHGGKLPLDVYLASWISAKTPKGHELAYFYYLEQEFRWDSLVQFVAFRVSHFKMTPAKLKKRVDPIYPPQFRAMHISATVRVYYVVGGDGNVYNAHAISCDNCSTDPDLRKAAEDAVIQWKFEPATVDGKPAEENADTVDLVFSPDK